LPFAAGAASEAFLKPALGLPVQSDFPLADGAPAPACAARLLALPASRRMVSSSSKLTRVLADFGGGFGPRRPVLTGAGASNAVRGTRAGRLEKRGGKSGIKAPNISFKAEGATSSTLPGGILPNWNGP